MPSSSEPTKPSAPALGDRPGSLRQLLIPYLPRDPSERLDRERMLDLLSSPGDPLSRHHFQPGHFTASAFVLDENRERLITLYHRKLGRWLQPGGHVEPGDPHLLAAALREVKEEVGLTRLVLLPEAPDLFDLDVHSIPPLGSDPEHAHFDVRFLFLAEGPPPAGSPEGRLTRWIELAAAPSLLSDRSVLRAVEKIADLRRG